MIIPKSIPKNPVNFSAAHLVKFSAKKLCYMRKKELKEEVTDLMLEGNVFADMSSHSPYVEMTNSFKTRKGYPIEIFYSIDEISLYENFVVLIEHKMVKFDPKPYYFHKSLLQTAFYKALVTLSGTKFKTADYVQGEKKELDIRSRSLFSELNFGGERFGVDCNVNELMKFYIRKARSSLRYESAEDFDYKYNQKEWDYLKKFVWFHNSGGKRVNV